MITNEQKARFIELRSEGKSYEAISRTMKISKHTAFNLGKQFESEVREATESEIRQLLERYKYQKTHRLKSSLKQLQRITKELESRDLSEASLRDLLLAAKLCEDQINNLSGESQGLINTTIKIVFE